MTSPFISIVMPVYGVEKYIHNSVKSVLAQTYTNYELIFVDDGSPDNCPQICDDYVAKHPNFRVIHQANRGLSIARNAGLSIACGDYVYFLDSDDTIQPDTLEYFAKVLQENNDIDFIFTQFQRVYEGDQFKPASTDDGYEVFDNRSIIQEGFLFRKYVILAPGTLYKISWLKENQFKFKPNPYSEDQLFVWELLLCVNKAVFIKKKLYNYLRHAGSIMTSTKYAKIKLAYPFFLELDKACQIAVNTSPLVKKYMLSRWVSGIFHSGAKLCSYEEFQDLLTTFEADKHLRNLKSFPRLRTKLYSSVYFISHRLYYLLNKSK